MKLSLFDLLRILTEKLPPSPNCRHNITLSPTWGEGGAMLVVTASADKGWHAFDIDPEDMDRPAAAVVDDIMRTIAKTRRIASQKAAAEAQAKGPPPTQKGVPGASSANPEGHTCGIEKGRASGQSRMDCDACFPRETGHCDCCYSPGDPDKVLLVTKYDRGDNVMMEEKLCADCRKARLK